MQLLTADPEMIDKLLASGWMRGDDDTNMFYWPAKLPRC